MFLITGSSGQLGYEMSCLLGDKAIYADRDTLDITDEKSVRAFFHSHDIDLVINCAAYTAVDKAEDDEIAAHLVNCTGAGLLAKYGRRIIHISTDYVFDGTVHVPYRETDEVCPLGVYGQTKLAGEQIVLKEAQTAVVIRTSWLYSAVGNNFVKTMRRLGSSRAQLGVIFDQIGTPTYAADLAKAIVAIIPQIKDGMHEIYHFSNEGVASWYDFACVIMDLSEIKCQVNPIETKDYPTRATRPAYSVLNKGKIKHDFDITIPHWMDALKRCIVALNRQECRED